LVDPVANASSVAAWLYRHQSQERRFHLANRLFLVLHNPNAPDQAWRLRGNVAALRASIDGFMARPRFVNLFLPDRDGNRRPIVTAVIAVTAPIVTRQLSLAFDIESPPIARTPSVGQPPSDLQMALPL
jgi:hypothetical protein